MKYIEPIKSFVLLFLVLLSLLFTFLIWNYKPPYLPTEEPQAEQMMGGIKKSLGEVIKPYRVLFATGESLRATDSSGETNHILRYLDQVEMSDVSPVPTPLTKDKVNEMVRTPDRMTMFFQTAIPLQIFTEVVSPNDEEYEGAVFDRLIVDWGESGQTEHVRLLFINTDDETGYSAEVEVREDAAFEETFIERPRSYAEYVETERQNNLSLYIVKEKVEATKHGYYIDEMSPTLLKDILFENPFIVQKSGEGSQESYTDSMSRLTLDTNTKIMNYVHPAAESSTAVAPYGLLKDTFDYVNEHGGFTADYRLSSIDIENHATEYQLYIEGYPVFSPVVMTRLVTTWGEEKIFRYRRPYYTMDTEIPSEKATVELASGPEVVDYIRSHEELNLDEIEDILVGYYLKQNESSRLFTVEPGWFFLTENSWSRMMPERLGGDGYGLE